MKALDFIARCIGWSMMIAVAANVVVGVVRLIAGW